MTHRRNIPVSILFAVLLLLPGHSAARGQVAPPAPRLVVIVVIDQLRADYLERFRRHFGTGGFNRLLDHGAWLKQARYEQAATKTCVGHAVVATGTHPSTSGIIGNDWWDTASARVEYCAHDAASPIIGAATEGRSPKNLKVQTIGDVLKQSNNGRSRVVTVAGKDRSAIMLGGHRADGAYWMQDTLFVTARFYRQELPAWVRTFNASGKVTSYFGRSWNRLLPDSAYARQTPDDQPGERDKARMGRAFPHVIGAGEAQPGKGFVEAFEWSPFQNEVVVDFAMEAIRRERLGHGPAADVFGLALSANDRVGHAFGPDSHEVMDATVRTDQLLSRFFAFLDEYVGATNVLIVLTSDHGVASLPEVMAEAKEGSGARRLDAREVERTLSAAMTRRYGALAHGRWIANHTAPYVYLDRQALMTARIEIGAAERTIQDALEQIPGIDVVLTATELREQLARGDRSAAVLSYFPGRSGDVMYFPRQNVFVQDDPDGTTHGTAWDYDSHVPILWYGPGIRPGAYDAPVSLADIAPTLAAILGISAPDGATGRVMREVLK